MEHYGWEKLGMMNLSDDVIEGMRGRDLDCAVAENIFGLKDIYTHMFSGSGHQLMGYDSNNAWVMVRYFSSRIEDAWEIVKWMQNDGWSFNVISHANPNGDFVISCWRRDTLNPEFDFTIRWNNFQEVLCKAVLMAKRRDVSTEKW